MDRVKVSARYLYQHHFIRYLIVGGSTFIIDLGILFSLHLGLKVDLAISTSIAYWLAVIYNFSLNRWWTFSSTEKENLKKNASLYLVVLIFNYLFTVIFVSLVSKHLYFAVAKVIAVLIQTSWTYYIYKNVIFIKKVKPQQNNP